MSLQQLPQHVAEAEHGVDLQPVRLAGQRRQRVIGAEDVARAVDQEDVVALLERAGDGGVGGGGFGGRGLCGGRLWRRVWIWAGMARMWAVGRRSNQCGTARRCESFRRLHAPGSACGLAAAPRPAARTGSASGVPRTAQYRRSAPITPAAVTSSEIGAEVGDDAGLEQHDAGRRHRQEEGEIDDDRVACRNSAAAGTRRSRAISAATATTAPAPSRPSASETNGRSAKPSSTSAPLSERPERQAGQRRLGLRLHARGEREDVRRENIAGVEIDEAAARTRRSRSSRCGCGAISSAAPTSQIASQRHAARQLHRRRRRSAADR